MRFQVSAAVLALCVCASPTLGQSAASDGEAPLKVFILAGQSNMVGAGVVAANEKRNGGKGSLEYLVNDEKTAADYKVQCGSVLHLVLALRGGQRV